MSNLSDKEIDRLSREAADSYEPDDSSLSWSRLEQKLIQQMPERPPDGFRFSRVNPYVWGPAVILFAGASFFLIKNIIYSQHSTRNSQIVNQPVPSSSADAKQAGSNTVHLDSISSAKPVIATESKKVSLSKQAVVSDDAIVKNKKRASSNQLVTETQSAETVTGAHANRTPAPDSKNSPAIRNISLINNQSVRKSPGSKTVIPGQVVNPGSISSGNSNTTNGLLAEEINGGTITGTNGISGNQGNKNQISLPFVVRTGTGLGKVSGNDSLLNQLAHSKTPIHQKSLHINRSLNFGLAFGPDYTDAGGITNNQIGNNIGLTMGYYITNKLSVNTGIFYTNKFYWSNAHNYRNQQPVNITPTAYARTFAAPPPIDYVNGASNIWELPLTLRYDFANNEKTKFFANAGLSSYFMMKQTYIFFLHSGQNPLAYKITDNSQVNYWLGVADLSLGFETEIGKGFSFQAEPFLKIPMEKMGLENLKLNSYGFVLSFRYSPVLSRMKK